MPENSTTHTTTIADLRHDPENARKHTPRNIGMIAHSLQRFGAARGIVIDEHGTVLAGNGVLEAAAQAGIEQVRVIETDGTEIVAVQVKHLTDEEKRQYAIADNRTTDLSEWDTDVLARFLDEGTDLSEWFFEDELAAILNGADDAPEVEPEPDNLYTRDTPSPVYTPTGEQPDVSELMDTTRRDELARDIAAVNLPDDVREFLNAAATRHVVFDYRKIAEFYAHADPEVQRLMEDSALVIVDFDRAIELGYVRLSSRLNDILAEAMDDA